MGILSNFIGSAATAGGEIMQRQREADVAVQSQKTLAEYNNELALKREETIRQAREEQGIREAGRAGERLTARDKELLDARLTEEDRVLGQTHIKKVGDADKAKAQVTLANRVALAPDAAAATEAEFRAGAPMRKAAEDEKQTFSLEAFKSKSLAERQAEVDKLNDPKYQQGIAAEARAKRDPSLAAAAGVQLKIAQLALAEKQAEAKIPPAVRLALEPYKKEMDLVGKAIAEAQGTNMFDAASQNGKDLLARHSAAAKAYSDKLTPFLPEGLKTPEKAAAGGPDVKYDAQGRAYVRGPDGKPMLKSDAEKATAKPADKPKSTQPADTPRDQGTRNPDIDAKGRALPRAEGADTSTALDRTVIPALRGAVDAASKAGEDGMKRYLSAKISRNEPLSPSEQVRAKQFGLLK